MSRYLNAFLWVALALFLISNAADYFYQADIFGWYNPLWTNGVRAPKWGDWDWFPHDAWHIAQWLRNLLLLAGGCVTSGVYCPANRRHWKYWVTTGLLAIALYLITRGLTFSLMLKIWN